MLGACRHLHVQLDASYGYFISIHVSGPYVLHFFIRLRGSDTQVQSQNSGKIKVSLFSPNQ